MKYNSLVIATALKNAVTAAQKEVGADDGGTCNFDAAYLRVPGMREVQAKEIEKMAGVTLCLGTYSYHGRILQVIGGTSGQGNRRTRMAEAMKKSLDESLTDFGVATGMWYQVD
jgi:hypothetical protein